jgi:transcriptional regulator with XRE-family HTH domain
MDYQAELQGFLTSRRHRITPEQAGLPRYTGIRRVPGLRREEVAQLAAISTDYYTRLERGKITGVSDEVLEAIARALQLGDVEREHLLSLARAVRPSPAARQPRKPKPRVRPQLQRVLDTFPSPAYIQNGRLDLVAANSIGWALFPHAQEAGPGQFNHLRFQFLDPRSRDFYRDWNTGTNNSVALLRAAVAHDPNDEESMKLVGELSMKSGRFRSLWAAHNVLRFRHGVKKYHHPIVGDLDFDFESFEVSGEPDLLMVVYVAEPHSPSAEAMQLLANWTGAGQAKSVEPASSDAAPDSRPR